MFFYSFSLNLPTNSFFIWSHICLFIQPISFLDGFMSLVVGRLVKLSLWSFRVIKELPVPFISIKSNIFACFANLITSLLTFVPTLKDHKENFTNHPTTRLINPSKNEIGRINKHILDQLNTELVSKLSANEWKNTISVIKWFKNINNKRLHKFWQLDIKDFYLSIKKKQLLHETIQAAKEYVPLTRKGVEVIFYA